MTQLDVMLLIMVLLLDPSHTARLAPQALTTILPQPPAFHALLRLPTVVLAHLQQLAEFATLDTTLAAEIAQLAT